MRRPVTFSPSFLLCPPVPPPGHSCIVTELTFECVQLIGHLSNLSNANGSRWTPQTAVKGVHLGEKQSPLTCFSRQRIQSGSALVGTRPTHWHAFNGIEVTANSLDETTRVRGNDQLLDGKSLVYLLQWRFIAPHAESAPCVFLCSSGWINLLRACV